jgi:hypothetical protein
MGNRVWFLNKYCYKPFSAPHRFPRVLPPVASFSSPRDVRTHPPCVHNVVFVCARIIRQALTPLPLDIYTCLFGTSANYILYFLTKRAPTRVFLTKDIPFFCFIFFRFFLRSGVLYTRARIKYYVNYFFLTRQPHYVHHVRIMYARTIYLDPCIHPVLHTNRLMYCITRDNTYTNYLFVVSIIFTVIDHTYLYWIDIKLFGNIEIILGRRFIGSVSRVSRYWLVAVLGIRRRRGRRDHIDQHIVHQTPSDLRAPRNGPRIDIAADHAGSQQ